MNTNRQTERQLHKQFVYTLQLTADNVGEVIETLTDIVLSADETEDQTSDNLRVIDDVLTRAAQTIEDSYESISLDVVNVVSACT